jgi:hypothetical protein
MAFPGILMRLPSRAEFRLLELYRKDSLLAASIRRLALLSGMAYPRAHEAAIALETRGVLALVSVGHARECRLRFGREAEALLAYLDAVHAAALDKAANAVVAPLAASLRDDILLVTGSYATGTQTSRSDVDVVIITRDDVVKKQRLAENLTLASRPSAHVIVLSHTDFIDGLCRKSSNFSHEVYKNRLLLQNAEAYHRLVALAVERGFKDASGAGRG